MIDRFVTDDKAVISAACDAMRLGHEFRTTIRRPDAEPKVQHWRGFVTRIARYGDGLQIEVNRFD